MSTYVGTRLVPSGKGKGGHASNRRQCRRSWAAPFVALASTALLGGCATSNPTSRAQGLDASPSEGGASAGGAVTVGPGGSDPGSSGGGAPGGGVAGGGASGGGASRGGASGETSVDGSVADGRAGATSFTDEELRAQGCALERRTSPYIGAETASTTTTVSGSGPIPCFVETGMGASETTIALAKDGTVYAAPAYTSNGNGIARSKDFGVTWDAIIPKFPNGGSHGRVQPSLYMDPSTERLFFATSVLFNSSSGTTAQTGFSLTWSSDRGVTWNYELIATDVRDWIKFYAGPPVTSHPEGYPSVIYASAPNPISTPGTFIYPPPDHQSVYKSLNGGQTWAMAGKLSLNPSDEVTAGLATATICPATEWVIFGNGTVGADGTVYLGFRMCTEVAVAQSHDEGATWTISVVPGSTMPPFSSILSPVVTNNLLASEPVAVDSVGNVYVIWNDAKNIVNLSVSKDHGKTWNGGNGPLVVSAPNVKASVLSGIAVKSPGTLAIAYFGSADTVKYDGYIAETKNALDPSPMFWSATANDPSKPLFPNGFDNNYTAGGIAGGDLDEIVQVKYAPNGDVWASFLEEMCPNLNTAACTWNYAEHANSFWQGALGRLVHR